MQAGQNVETSAVCIAVLWFGLDGILPKLLVIILYFYFFIGLQFRAGRLTMPCLHKALFVMCNFVEQLSSPYLLKDKTRLSEIFHLRVEAWEHSHNSKFVNHELLPNGWYDNLDETAIHWIITDHKNIIIGSARFNVVENITQIPNHHIFEKFIHIYPKKIGFYSRLCIHPSFRRNGLASLLDLARIEYIKTENIPLTLATSDGIRTKRLQQHGFTILGQDNITFLPNTEQFLLADVIALDLFNLYGSKSSA